MSGLTETDIRLLYARRQRILARLSSLSNGTTTVAPDGSGHTVRPRADMSTAKGRALAASPGAKPDRHAESRLPPGTRANADLGEEAPERPPSRDVDLHGHYLYRFKEAKGDFWQTEKLCAMAERDYQREVRGSRNVNEHGLRKDQRILDEYAGLPPWEVATWEGCHPLSVVRLRREAGLNPEDGLEVELDERTQRILDLKRQKMTQREIARIVGVGVATVNRTLAGVA